LTPLQERVGEEDHDGEIEQIPEGREESDNKSS